MSTKNCTSTLSFMTVALLGLGAAPMHDAQAHARFKLDGPTKPRDASTGLKTAPCGNVPRTTTPAQFTPGQIISVEWEETFDHPGYYRIAFSPANDLDFDKNVLMDNIADTLNAETPMPHYYKAMVALPNQTCDQCTLQLIQVMTDSNPPGRYYSCSDIKLVAAQTMTAASGGSTSGGGGTTMPGSTLTKEQMAQQLIDHFDTTDVNHSGGIDYNEAANAIPGLSTSQFYALDIATRDGVLSKAELQNIATPPTATTTDTTAGGKGSFEWLSVLAGIGLLWRRRKQT